MLDDAAGPAVAVADCSILTCRELRADCAKQQKRASSLTVLRRSEAYLLAGMVRVGFLRPVPTLMQCQRRMQCYGQQLRWKLSLPAEGCWIELAS